jgi:hypothetical protein
MSDRAAARLPTFINPDAFAPRRREAMLEKEIAMRSRILRQDKAAAAQAAADEEKTVQHDRFRAQLGMSLVSDMFEHHKQCGFKECRAAGRCLAYDRAAGMCPMPLDTTRALTFAGMMLFHDVLRAEVFGEGA